MIIMQFGAKHSEMTQESPHLPFAMLQANNRSVVICEIYYSISNSFQTLENVNMVKSS